MSCYIGIDLGTSAVKTLLLSQQGVLKTVSRSYDVSYPQDGWSQQNPCDWYEQTMDALEELLEGADKGSVSAISFSGQMHGLVMLDEMDQVIRPAILWNDGRSVKEVDYLNNEVGTDFLLEHTGNIAFAGFTAPKVLWVRANEPDSFARVSKILLPKDYLAYRLCGEACTDVSDASGTLYFDVKNRRWSPEMLELLHIREDQLPKVLESCQQAGVLKQDIAARLGLPENVKVIIGAGDNAASAVGTGTTRGGDCNISLGTSGTIFAVSDTFNYDSNSAIHAFCSASGGYHYLACILSAASAQKWWIEDILKADYSINDRLRPYAGKNDVYFLPYLMGERSPINDPKARGLFYGMTPNTTREEMTLAVIEGVSFALRQNLDIIRSLGVEINTSRICGGGCKNRLWLEILASILHVKLLLPRLEQGGALGAALLAAQADMTAEEYDAFAEPLLEIGETILPDEELASAYDRRYASFAKIYPAIKGILA